MNRGVADVNADGNVDLVGVRTGSEGGLYVALGTGSGTFLKAQRWSVDVSGLNGGATASDRLFASSPARFDFVSNAGLATLGTTAFSYVRHR
jgi:hypothetical protein